MSKRLGLYPCVRVEGGGRRVVSQAGAVLLVETVRKSGLDTAILAAMAPWRKQRSVHDPGKVLLDVALATALGGDCLADVAVTRAEPEVFGPVASDPTVSRLIDALAAAGPRALTAIRSARADIRARVWELAGANSPAADGQVIVDIDGVLVLAHSEKQDATATWKKTYGQHPLVAFVDHGQDGSGEPVAALLRPGNAGSNTASDHITTTGLALAQLPKPLRRGRQTLSWAPQAGEGKSVRAMQDGGALRVPRLDEQQLSGARPGTSETLGGHHVEQGWPAQLRPVRQPAPALQPRAEAELLWDVFPLDVGVQDVQDPAQHLAVRDRKTAGVMKAAFLLRQQRLDPVPEVAQYAPR